MRDRTADLLDANQALSQLSYSPIRKLITQKMVGLGGFEPPTSPLSGVRSNQLSYRPLISNNLTLGYWSFSLTLILSNNLCEHSCFS